MSRLRGPPHRGVRRISPNLRPDDLPPPIHPITLARHDIPLGMLLPRRLLGERAASVAVAGLTDSTQKADVVPLKKDKNAA